jgi:Ketosteroid isomerase homolog
MRARFLLLFVLALATPVWGEGRDKSDREIREALDHFLHAFENLDIQSFMRCFARDATVFFPVPEPPNLFEGKEAIQDHFEQVFAAIRQSSNRTNPPFHRLVPEHLHVQLLGDASVLVTFQMSNAERLARRTFVFQKRGERWLIVHLHASNVSGITATPTQLNQP